MDSRTRDIFGFLAALCVVAGIAFFLGLPQGETESLDVSGTTTDIPRGSLNGSEISVSQLNLPSYMTKDKRKWLISRQISGGMDYYLPNTRDYAVRYIPGEHEGVYSIEQVCDLWDGSISEWRYDAGSGGLLDISSASESINTGLEGDEADYAVFLASMIKGIGGEARIKSVTGTKGGEYPYVELYLGNTEDLNTKIINNESLEQLKSNYSAIFANDPSGLSVFKYRYGRICSGETCYDYVNPLFEILNDPGRYGEICYNYPKLIEYLMLFPDTNEIEFQLLYIQVRYGEYDEKYHELRDVREVHYSYNFEENGDVTYWLGLDLFGSYPGDTLVRDVGSATVYYSDGYYDTVRVNEGVAPVIN